jgi:hypothetical protein
MLDDRDQVGEALADAGAGLDGQVPALLSNARRIAQAMRICCGRASKPGIAAAIGPPRPQNSRAFAICSSCAT